MSVFPHVTDLRLDRQVTDILIDSKKPLLSRFGTPFAGLLLTSKPVKLCYFSSL
jgi:hypothetical protein